MKRGITLGIVISVVMVLLFAACAAPETTPTATPSPTPTVTPTPVETLPELLDRAAGIASVKYDQVMTSPEMPGESMQMKVWIKGNKTRSEMTAEGQTAVIIMDWDAQVGYMYIPAQNMATKMDLSGQQEVRAVASMSALELSKFILAHPEAVAVGSETMDGKDCLVVEAGDEQGKAKAWIWKEYGFPIRIDFLGMISDFKNIEFVSIPDDMFELPSGVKIQEQ